MLSEGEARAPGTPFDRLRANGGWGRATSLRSSRGSGLGCARQDASTSLGTNGVGVGATFRPLVLSEGEARAPGTPFDRLRANGGWGRATSLRSSRGSGLGCARQDASTLLGTNGLWVGMTFRPFVLREVEARASGTPFDTLRANDLWGHVTSFRSSRAKSRDGTHATGASTSLGTNGLGCAFRCSQPPFVLSLSKHVPGARPASRPHTLPRRLPA